jgi:predicted HicB family RNase H-like nuclease
MEMAVANPFTPNMPADANPMPMPVGHEDRRGTAQRIANEMFQQQPDWITFFREVLGVDGLLRKLFVTPEDLAAFEKTEEYNEIQLMLAKLRDRSGAAADGREPTRVITVRLPKSLHESLRAEAHDRKTSMNQLCISKLLQVIDAELIAAE